MHEQKPSVTASVVAFGRGLGVRGLPRDAPRGAGRAGGCVKTRKHEC